MSHNYFHFEEDILKPLIKFARNIRIQQPQSAWAYPKRIQNQSSSSLYRLFVHFPHLCYNLQFIKISKIPGCSQYSIDFILSFCWTFIQMPFCLTDIIFYQLVQISVVQFNIVGLISDIILAIAIPICLQNICSLSLSPNLKIILQIMPLVFINDIVIAIVEIPFVFVWVMVKAAVSLFIEAWCPIRRDLYILLVSICVRVVSTANFIPAFFFFTRNLSNCVLFFMGIKIVYHSSHNLLKKAFSNLERLFSFLRCF